MRIIGVDPGLDGAIAIMEDKTLLAVHDMPTFEVVKTGRKTKTARELDEAQCASIIKSYGALLLTDQVAAYVELVGPMPKQGVASTFSFGMGFGVIRGILSTLAIPRHYILPTVWKRAAQLPVGAEKDESRRKVLELGLGDPEWFSLKKHHGRADATLIALYGANTVVRL